MRWTGLGLIAVGLLHVPPAVGALSSQALARLYGTAAGNSALQILLQHRGAMFALVAAACFVASAYPQWRQAATILAGWSMAGFLVAYLAAGAPAGPLRAVALADAVGLAILLPIAVAAWR